VGDFGIYSDINHLTDGLSTHAVPFGFPGAHGGPGYGFYGGLKLVGDCPALYPTGGPALRYRFLVEVLGGGGLQPVTAAQIIAVKVGTRPIVWNVSGTPAPVVTAQDIYVAPFGAPPGTVAPPTPAPALPPSVPWGPIPPAIMVPDAQGWVPVDPSATNGGFSGPLLRLDSNTVVPGGAAPGSGAGNAVASPQSGKLVRIVFEAEPLTGATGATPTLTNELERLLVNNWSDVNLLGLLQFSGPGSTACSGLSNALDIQYTTDHELLAAWTMLVSGVADHAPDAHRRRDRRLRPHQLCDVLQGLNAADGPPHGGPSSHSTGEIMFASPSRSRAPCPRCAQRAGSTGTASRS
jgi:hypothetical protein